MQRVTVTLDDELMAELDRIIAARGYQNRSEIIRDLARAGLQQSTEDTAQTGPCVAGLVYVYDHAARALGQPTASRAVGAANGKNPISIVAPCHRVIGTNGSLTGFAGGLEAKQRLLALEGLELAECFTRLPSAHLRRSLLDLARAMSEAA